jgi:hypothetical protein
VLLTDAPLLASTAGNLWLHNLLLRHQGSERGNAAPPTMVAVGGAGPAALWLTHVTFQGQGTYEENNAKGCKALRAEHPVYMEGEG